MDRTTVYETVNGGSNPPESTTIELWFYINTKGI